MRPTELKWLLAQAGDSYTKESISKINDDQRGWRQRHALKLVGQFIWLNKHNPYASLETYVEIFKYQTHSKIKEFPHISDKLIVDIGANEGMYTLYVKKNFPKARIIAVEPNPIAFAVLKKNVLANKLHSVVLEQKAITSRDGNISFEIMATATMLSGIKIPRENWMQRGSIKKITVVSTSLARLIQKYRIDQVDLIKIDTEGSELDILRSSKKELHRFKKVVVEYHSQRLRGHIKRLLQTYFILMKDEKIDYGDLYFIRK